MTPSASWKQQAAAIILATNPWTWLVLLFGAQAIGSLIITHLFRIDFSETRTAIFLLASGALLSSLLRWRDPSGRMYPQKSILLAVIYALFIFSLSSESLTDACPPFGTKIFHPLEYMTFGILLCCAWSPVRERKGTPVFLAGVFLTGVLYGMSDEFHQSFVPFRTPAIIDVSWDTLGLLLGSAAFLAAGHIRERFDSFLAS